MLPEYVTKRGTKHKLKIPVAESKKRDKIIFGETKNWAGSKKIKSIKRFRITTKQADELLGEHLNPNMKQNKGPKAQVMVSHGKFLNSTVEIGIKPVLKGYVVSPYREDTRVTLDGIICEPQNPSGQKFKDSLIDYYKTMYDGADSSFTASNNMLKAVWD